MISEQTAIHVPTSALRVRALADMAVAIEATGIRPTGWRRRLQVVAEQARTVTLAVLGALASWRKPCLFARALRFCIAIGNNSVRVCQRALVAAWMSYVDAHVLTLRDGTTVWIDEYQSFVIDTPGTLTEARWVSTTSGSRRRYRAGEPARNQCSRSYRPPLDGEFSPAGRV